MHDERRERQQQQQLKREKENEHNNEKDSVLSQSFSYIPAHNCNVFVSQQYYE